jgi:hypothetical protein
MKENGNSANQASYLAFHTRADGGSPAEKVRITSGGQLRIMNSGSAKISIYHDSSGLNHITSNSGQEFKVSSGNGDSNGIEFWDYTGTNKRCQIDGHGIKFNADTAEDNALSDYEEGEVTISTTASNGNALTVDSSNNKLTYTKIGNVVNIFGYVYFASNSNADGYVQINSLPFTVKDASGSSAHARFVNTAYLTRNYAYLPDGAGYYNVQGYANESNTWLRYYDLNGSGRRLSTLAKFLGSGTVINVNFAYLTA